MNKKLGSQLSNRYKKSVVDSYIEKIETDILTVSTEGFETDSFNTECLEEKRELKKKGDKKKEKRELQKAEEKRELQKAEEKRELQKAEETVSKKNEITDKSTIKESKEDFDWKEYVSFYDDLKEIKTKEEAWEHWTNHGKHEKRVYFSCDEMNNNDEYKLFDWKTYLKNYKDLRDSGINTHLKAWIHWINYGKKEERVIYDIYEKELKDYQEIKKKENEIITINGKLDNNEKNGIIFKPLYDSYGVHYFGWRGVINSFVKCYQEKNIGFEEMFFFDEWIEKLLLWGNKIQNEEYIKSLEMKNAKLITFLHNPPCENLENKEYNKKIKNEIIMNDEQMNKNIIHKMENIMLHNLEFLYVLSNDHKRHIYFRYPNLQNKVVSVYHSIDLSLSVKEKEFNPDLFFKSRNIFHIGWWLRNFKTFLDFELPVNFKKKILIKNDFKREWENHIVKNNEIEKVKVIDQLSNEEYCKIFEKSCIFIDLEDSTANNVILECLKFNTPFITRYNKSLEEYVGADYPLFFNEKSELEILKDKNIFMDAVKDSYEYLKNLDKTHIHTNFFNKKLEYDFDKLKLKKNESQLTWICFITKKSENELIPYFVKRFLLQENQRELKLVMISQEEVSNVDYAENIYFITSSNSEIINQFITNLDTKYIGLMSLYDKYKANYSHLCIEYLNNNKNVDFIFSSFKMITQEDNKIEQYEKRMYFMEDIEKGTYMPKSGFVFRKTIYSILNLLLFNLNPEVIYPFCMKQHLNVSCISFEPLYVHY